MTPEDLLKAIGKNIKEAREEKNIGGDWLARKLNISRPAVTQLERGEKNFKIAELFEIAELLGTDVCTLVSINTIHDRRGFGGIPKSQKNILVNADMFGELLTEVKTLTRNFKK